VPPAHAASPFGLDRGICWPVKGVDSANTIAFQKPSSPLLSPRPQPMWRQQLRDLHVASTWSEPIAHETPGNIRDSVL